ncbi:MAG TPA: hypothetical protein VEX38_09655, partial [Fimbriimonadaceae bacterium]|nr:hypothetical protein [Fimbriimonadaceae bacterium]
GRREGAKPDPHAYTVSMVTRAKVEDKPQPIRLTSPLWITYAAHAVLRSDNDNVLSGDWPGALAAQLNTSVLPGAIGDASPVASGDSGAKKVENFFHSFSQTWVSAFAAQKPAWKPGQAFSFVRQPVKLGDAKANPEFARANKIPEPLAETLVKRFAPAEAEITAFRVGKLAVVGVPGEPTSHLGAAISAAGKKLGFSPVLVVSHVNGWAGYMLDAKDYAKGGYEATLSFYGPEGGPKVVTAATEALRRLR